MRSTRLALAVVLALAGAVWLGQGLGLIGGSFMTGIGFWAIAGAALIAAAVAVVALEWRGR